jgi:hypothetical protein
MRRTRVQEEWNPEHREYRCYAADTSNTGSAAGLGRPVRSGHEGLDGVAAASAGLLASGKQSDDLAPGTLNSILKQAGLKE